LSDNQISNVRNLFVGLENLQLLNISRNSIRHFGRNHLFSLTKSVKILTDGNILWSIGTSVFANSFLKDIEEIKRLLAMKDQENPKKIKEHENREQKSIKLRKLSFKIKKSSKLLASTSD